MAYYLHGLLQASFALVEFPGLLMPGFGPHLQRLQKLAHWPVIAFDAQVAPLDLMAEHVISPPAYASGSEFRYDLSDIRTKPSTSSNGDLKLHPMQHSELSPQANNILEDLRNETILDDSQAVALCESLSRGLAFTQGPPGTGKSFLGVSLAQVILASQDKSDPKPILVVCMTNHALDSFLADLLKKGITRIARLGGGSKQDWTKRYRLRELSSKLKLTYIERNRLKEARVQVENLTRSGLGWTDSINNNRLGWSALQDYLKKCHKHVFDQFSNLERIDSDITDLRRAKRYAGFGYEFWLNGGDIKDLEGLLDAVNTLLGNCSLPQDSNPSLSEDFRERLLASVKQNASNVALTTEENIWALSVAERHALVTSWIQNLDLWKICDAIAEVHRRHQSAINRRKVAYQAIDARFLAEQQVIGLTTSGVANYWDLLNHLNLRVTIVEEAGEVLEAHSLVTLGLHSLVHFVSIGDPQQLRPQVNEVTLSIEHTIGQSYRLDESLFERLMFPSIEGATPVPISRLNVQRRMHPDIADISRATFYPCLIDHESTAHHPNVTGMADRLYWVDHRQSEDCPDPRSPMAKSHSNRHEVEMVVALVQYLIERGGYSLGEVAILTPYNGQLAALTGRLRKTCSVWLSEKDREALIDQGLLPADLDLAPTVVKIDVDLGSMLRVSTIDNFQGEEAKVVIFSAVRSNHDRVGFLSTVNRVNVACTRARDGFYIIGNAALMASVNIWSKVIEVFRSKGKIGPSFRACCSQHPDRVFDISEPEQFYQIPACQFPCTAPLPCDHVCSYKCHSPAIHQLTPCIERCKRLHPCGHQCENSCGSPCGECTYKLPPVTLSCGHEHYPTCSGTLKSLKVECQHPIDNALLPCGDILCSSANEPLVCRAPCGATLDCGHKCLMSCATCQKSSKHRNCQSSCAIELGCGHKCTAQCGHTGNCPPCKERCQKSCQHGKCKQICGRICDPCVRPCGWECEHHGSCQTCCSLPCDRLPCNEPCAKFLTCGQHICPSLCDEICPTNCVQCGNRSSFDQPQIFLPCGHNFDVQTLDSHVGIQNRDCLNTEANSDSGSVTEIPSPDSLVCPNCAVPIKGIRRYLIVTQMAALPETVDRLYAKLGRKLDKLNYETYRNEELLSLTFESFCKRLSTEMRRLSGKRDKDMIWTRGNAMLKVQTKAAAFRDEVVIPFEESLSRLRVFLGKQNIFASAVLPFRLRHDFLYYRCRVVTLDEALQLFLFMQTLDQTHPHTAIITEGLRIKVTEQALENIKGLESKITKSETLNLKRLEVEFRLLQVSFHMIARGLNTDSHLDVAASFQKIIKLCSRYPDTAGRLLPNFVSIKAYYDGGSAPKRLQNWHAMDVRELWKNWGSHKVGYLVHCPFGHPYSTATFADCPECGREIMPPDPEPIASHNKFLYEEEFLAAIRLRQGVTV